MKKKIYTVIICLITISNINGQNSIELINTDTNSVSQKSISYQNDYVKLSVQGANTKDIYAIHSCDLRIVSFDRYFWVKLKENPHIPKGTNIYLYKKNSPNDSQLIKVERFQLVPKDKHFSVYLGNICEESTTIKRILKQDSLKIHQYNFKYGDSSRINFYTLTVLYSDSAVYRESFESAKFSLQTRMKIKEFEDVKMILFSSIKMKTKFDGIDKEVTLRPFLYKILK